MTFDPSVADSELPTLKRLAGEIAAAEAPVLSVLDEIAALAGAIATRCREGARRRLFDEVIAEAQGIFAGGADALRSRLENSPLDELSGLASLLEKATASRAAFVRADADLMAARDKGDYAAMAPLAIEADTQKTAFAGASGDFAGRLGLAGVLIAEVAAAPAPPPPAAAPPAAEPPPPSIESAYAPAAGRGEEEAAELAASDGPGEGFGFAGLQAPSQSERRRIRDLIRQVRTTADDAS